MRLMCCLQRRSDILRVLPTMVPPSVPDPVDEPVSALTEPSWLRAGWCHGLRVSAVLAGIVENSGCCVDWLKELLVPPGVCICFVCHPLSRVPALVLFGRYCFYCQCPGHWQGIVKQSMTDYCDTDRIVIYLPVAE